MVTVETRALQPSEREELVRILARAKERSEALVAAMIAFVIVAGPALLVWPWQQGIRSLPPVLAGLLAALFVYQRMRVKRASWRAVSMLEEELAADQAEVTTYEVLDAIAVEEQGDEGSQYFLKLRDERILFVAGQYLYELEDDKHFPSTRFQVVKTPRTRQLLAVNCVGDYLRPSSRRQPFTPAEHRAGQVPEDGAVWQGDFEALRRNPN